jgi:quercetin dioxygenase-like cupin family protein
MGMELDVGHAVFLRPAEGEGETITDQPGRTIRILLDHELLVATWARYEPGERGPGPHVHRQHTDGFYVLEGALVFGLGPEVEPVRAPAGTFVAVPHDVVHTFANEGSDRACFLNFHAPNSGFAESLRGRPEGFDSFAPPEDGGRPADEAIVSGPGEGERVGSGPRAHRVKAEFEQLSAIELSFDPGWEGVDPHTHDDHVDAFFVLEGTVGFVVGTEDRRGGPGTFVAATPGARHGFGNPGESRIALLNLHAPDTGFVSRLRG